ncbi:MAG: transposase [Methanobacteriaceae archaeon]|jgi:transposase|nr:transposase [Candidatus Methanorudis spinitermitis]
MKIIAAILNINLIYLPKNSDELNSIEDVWCLIKDRISNKFIKNKKHLESFTRTSFTKK